MDGRLPYAYAYVYAYVFMYLCIYVCDMSHPMHTHMLVS